MFANFELSSVGLVETDVKPKRTRTDLGCLPCRRKKKKCDLSKPSCLRCRKSTGRVVCEWPKHTSVSPPPDEGAPGPVISGTTCADPEPTNPRPIKAETPSDEGSSVVLSSGKSVYDFAGPQSHSDRQVWKPPTPQPGPQIGHGITIRLPASVRKITPTLSSSDLIQLTAAFDKATISRDHKSMAGPASSLSLPLLLAHPALMHAWLCCSTAFVAGRQKGGLQRAFTHYQCSVTDLKSAIGGSGTASPEWKLATVLLLHTFESMSPADGSPAAIRVAHLNGAHSLVRMSMMHRAPTSTHEVLVLEAYAFRTITNRLFHPFPTLPYTHISQLWASMCAPGSPRDSVTASWRTSPWTGMSALTFDYIFKLSYLRPHVPLSGDDLVEVLSLSKRLENWQPPVSAPEDLFDVDSKTADVHMLKSLLTAKAYWYAARLLCHKMLNPHAGPLDPGTEGFLRSGRKVLQQLALMKHANFMVLWPTLVLGCAAVTHEQRRDYTAIINLCSEIAGNGSIARATCFLDTAWADGRDTDAGFLGSDILLRGDLLEHMYF